MIRVVFNQKGGVGKSTITCNLAAIAANSGKRTLVVDLDVQGNASRYLLGDNFSKDQKGIADYFEESLSFRLTGSDPKSFITYTPYPDLHIITASPRLADLQHKLENRHKVFKLKELLNKLSKEYEEIYIDTPPAFNFYTLSALIVADGCLVPFDCDDFSRQALYVLMDNMAETQLDHNPDLRLEGIVVNQYQPRAKLPNKLIGELKSEELPVLNAFISTSIVVKESHEQNRPLIHLEPGHKVSQEFIELYKLLCA